MINESQSSGVSMNCDSLILVIYTNPSVSTSAMYAGSPFSQTVVTVRSSTIAGFILMRLDAAASST